MRRWSIARSLLLALVGLTVVLAVITAAAVSAMYSARQDYEDALARTYAVETAGANLLTASVVEEAVRRSGRGGATARDQAQATFERAARAARGAAQGDAVSQRLVAVVERSHGRARAARDPAPPLRQARAAIRGLVDRQDGRRATARDRVSDRTRGAVALAAVAGGSALLAALALVWVLVGGLRRPLVHLVGATRRLAGGDLDARVEPEGPAELRELGGAFNAMAADLRTAADRVLAGRRRLDAVVQSLGDALVICDGDGRVLQVNPRAEVLVPELEPGRSIAEPHGQLPALGDALGAEAEVEVAHHGRMLAVTAARIGTEIDDGVVFTVRDTTERARLEQAKSDFVATASHELRSPLTSIKGFVELLGRTEVSPRQREFLDVIAVSTDRLVDLVNDLLDVARVEAGQLEVQRRPIAVEEAVQEVAALMRPRFDERGQELVVDVASALPPALADPGRIRQVVTNLLTNAHLYTPDGGRVTVSVGASGDEVVLSVADTGRGMSPEHVEHAFERFYRADAHGVGTGLGLSIVRSLVDLHAGTVDLASEPGVGTTVTVRLPRAHEGEPDVPRGTLRGRRVLVVEDDPEVAELIARHLGPLDVTVETAASGEAALEALRREPFDAMTIDILLGGMDGFEVLRRVREDPELAGTPVIVVSGSAGQEALAAEWSVTKPIDANELAEAVGAALQADRARVLVVGREEVRQGVAAMLSRRGVEHVWAHTGAEAARLCEERRFEVALVDAGMHSPQAALAQLDLRGRRLRRSVVVFSTGEDAAPGLARLDPDPVPLEDATQAVVEALRSGTGARSAR